MRFSTPARGARRWQHSKASPAHKHLQRSEECARIALALINGWRRGTTIEQSVDRLPGRADGAFDGEGNLPGDLDVLTDESEIGGPLRDRRRPVAAAPRKPDVVDVGHVA